VLLLLGLPHLHSHICIVLLLLLIWQDSLDEEGA
jgi:hypothetical protein